MLRLLQLAGSHVRSNSVARLSDDRLFDWWMLPQQLEYVYYDADPPRTGIIPISLWNLGNR